MIVGAERPAASEPDGTETTRPDLPAASPVSPAATSGTPGVAVFSTPGAAAKAAAEFAGS